MRRVAAVVVAVTGLAGISSAQVPAGGEFQVNTYTPGRQATSSVASDPRGNFVVAWESHGQDGSGIGIFGQRYDAAGAPLGPEFRVNSQTAGDQSRPAVAVDATGDFVVVWESDGQDGNLAGIFGRRYDASGAPTGAEFQVNLTTVGSQTEPAVAMDPAGNFVVAWTSDGQDGSGRGVFAQRFGSWAGRVGPEFGVNTYTTGDQQEPSVATDAAGNFVVAWSDNHYYGTVDARRFDASGAPRGAVIQVSNHLWVGGPGVVTDPAGNFVVVWPHCTYWPIPPVPPFKQVVSAQRYDASGDPLGQSFRVTTGSTPVGCYPNGDFYSSVSMEASGNFIVAWDGDPVGNIEVRRFEASGAGRGAELRINTNTSARLPAVASDATGNFLVAWEQTPDGSQEGAFARRFGGIVPSALAVGGADANGVLEPGESVDIHPSWRNVNGAAQTFGGTILGFGGPPATGVTYQLLDGSGAYGTVPHGIPAICSDCYQVAIGFAGTRPETHWDATLTERLTPDVLGQTMPWSLHIGESFTDVPKTSPFYRFAETLLHAGVTAGCGSGTYCPTARTTREQMAAFVLPAKEGAGYAPAPCSPPNLFADVPEYHPFCDVIEELARRGVVGGCGSGLFCPALAVSREQMAVFVLLTLDPTLNPPACTAPMFADVPASSPFCRWIEELARRGVVAGCGGGNYCPTLAVSREQMAVFLSVTFDLRLYGP